MNIKLKLMRLSFKFICWAFDAIENEVTEDFKMRLKSNYYRSKKEFRPDHNTIAHKGDRLIYFGDWK